MTTPILVSPEQVSEMKRQIIVHDSVIKQLNVAKSAGSPVDESIQTLTKTRADLQKQVEAWTKYWKDEGVAIP